MLCGSCSYVCPSKIPLAQLFQASKVALRSAKAGAKDRRAASSRDRSPPPRRLVIAASPHLRGPASTPVDHVERRRQPVPTRRRRDVLLRAECAARRRRGGRRRRARPSTRSAKARTIGDGSAAITGILLGLTLPAGHADVDGGARRSSFGIAFGKLIFGGLGYNVFNPALFGRAFLQAAFPSRSRRGRPSASGTGGRCAATTSRCRSCIRAPRMRSPPPRRSAS